MQECGKTYYLYFQSVCAAASEIFDMLGHMLIAPSDISAKAKNFGKIYKEAGFAEDVTPYIHGM